MAILHLPYVQNRVLHNFLYKLSSTTQFSIKHQQFYLTWFRYASLQGLTIRDPQNNEMLFIDKLTCKINPIQIINNYSITLEAVRIKGASLQLRKARDGTLNISRFIQQLLSVYPPKNKAKPFVIKSTSFLQDIDCVVEHPAAGPLTNWPNPLKFNKVNATFTNLKAQAHTFSVAIHSLTCTDTNGPLWLDSFCTAMRMTPHTMQCTGLKVQTKRSQLKGTVELTYEGTPIANAHITAQVDEARLATEELGKFIPYFKQHDTVYTFCGQFLGKVNDFRITNFELIEGKSHLKGAIRLQGLPNVQETLFTIALQSGTLHATDLLPYLGKTYVEKLASLRVCKLQQVNFFGAPTNFIAQGTLDTNLGVISTDINFITETSLPHMAYQGTITTQDFRLGALLGTPTLQKLSMQARIAGKGLRWATANLQVKANISKLGFKHYNYKHIAIKGSIAKKRFQGNFFSKDPNLQVAMHALVDLRGLQDTVSIQGFIDHAALKALHLTEQNVTLRTKLALTMHRPSLERILGNVQLNQLCVGYEGKELQLEAMHICTDQGVADSLFELDSDLIAVKATGNFAYTTLVDDLKQCLQACQQYGVKATLPAPKSLPYSLAYKVKLTNINPLLGILLPTAYIAPNTTLEGSLARNEETTFALRLAEVSTIAFDKHVFSKTQLDITACQSKENNKQHAVVKLTSKAQQWLGRNTTENLSLTIVWQDNQASFKHTLAQQGGNQFNFQGEVGLLDKAIVIKLHPIAICIADNPWQIHPENRILITKAGAQFQNFELFSGAQQITVTGTMAAQKHEVLQLQFKDCALNNLNVLLPQKLTGKVSGLGILYGALDKLWLDSHFVIQNLMVNDFVVGDIDANLHWNEQAKQLRMACQLSYLQRKTVAITGLYMPKQAENSLQLVANFTQARLAALEPFVVNLFSQLEGNLTGMVHINGTPANPQLTGKGEITDATLRVNYLNTVYNFQGDFTWANQVIHFNALHLTDDQAGKALLKGNISYKTWKDFHIDLAGSIKHFKVLNTTAQDNAYYYGSGIVSGDVAFVGPIKNVGIHVKATTEKGTRLSIATKQNALQSAQTGYIQFVPFKRKQSPQAGQPTATDLEGITLLLDLAITPAMHTKFIVGPAIGDAISGNGKGHIHLKVGTKSTLHITGHYVFEEGTYDFSVFGLLRRTFQLAKGSKVVWEDELYKGTLAMQAFYEQHVTLTPLLPIGSAIQTLTAKSTYPVHVVLGVHGLLVAPTIDLQINFQEMPDNTALQAAITNFQAQVATDKQYLDTQVLNLIILNRLVNHKSTYIDVQEIVDNTISTFISQQLSSLSTRLDKNLHIQPAITPEDWLPFRNGLKDLRVKLSYNLWKDKLSVSSSIGLQTSLLEDWLITYKLTENGNVRAKVYRKYANDIGVGGNTAAFGGVTLLYMKRFDHWREFFRRPRSKQKNTL